MRDLLLEINHILLYASCVLFAFPIFSQNFHIPPADYDADGHADIARVSPTSPLLTWRWANREGQESVFEYGVLGDIPFRADYDGNGNMEWSIYRPSDQSWHIAGPVMPMTVFQFGSLEGYPFVGDFDGDGKTDTGMFISALALGLEILIALSFK